ncbi:efflux RND transporter periplasmic adaptor subunit [Paraferrimonas sedimenticola]|uniref:MexE family multidrug efflux RND transporter periplasmic adaptor subunit n=1 Tax=Paraferrimonas sedimenticola TaxID=375674 RepID=A0AA37RVU7_9GAMM|nr:efflux RND transporter periplasmic adaptor subunit [Paraferrimonas sedimenticola]GLP95804.1 MexE family multidrug efflux RND transporter periplasmic adaptor subunit [Paraferrimonas sedimenticola]
MKKALLAMVVAATLVGCGSEVNQAANQELAPQSVPVVVSQTSQNEFVETHSALVQPKDMVEVSSRTQGYLLKTHVKAGEQVEKGQLLYELDAVDYELAKAELDSQLAIANTQLEMAKREYDRATRLKESLSLQERDEVETTFKLSQGQVQLLERQIDRIALDIERTKIVAPISGVIGEKTFDEGALISTGQVLNNIVNDAKVEVVLNLDEKKLLAMIEDLRQGTADFRARLQLIDGTVMQQEGEVTSIDNKINPSTGSLAMKVEFDNSDRTLYSGQYAQLQVIRIADAMMLPQQAVISAPDGNYVYAVEDGKVVRVDITTGDAQDGNRVVYGVKEGTQVIVQGQSRLAVGEPVSIEG